MTRFWRQALFSASFLFVLGSFAKDYDASRAQSALNGSSAAAANREIPREAFGDPQFILKIADRLERTDGLLFISDCPRFLLRSEIWESVEVQRVIHSEAFLGGSLPKGADLLLINSLFSDREFAFVLENSTIQNRIAESLSELAESDFDRLKSSGWFPYTGSNRRGGPGPYQAPVRVETPQNQKLWNLILSGTNSSITEALASSFVRGDKSAVELMARGSVELLNLSEVRQSFLAARYNPDTLKALIDHLLDSPQLLKTHAFAELIKTDEFSFHFAEELAFKLKHKVDLARLSALMQSAEFSFLHENVDISNAILGGVNEQGNINQFYSSPFCEAVLFWTPERIHRLVDARSLAYFANLEATEVATAAVQRIARLISLGNRQGLLAVTTKSIAGRSEIEAAIRSSYSAGVKATRNFVASPQISNVVSWDLPPYFHELRR